MLQGEQATAGKVNLLTNTVNNYAIFSYLIFGGLLNFTNASTNLAYIVIILVGLFFYHGLPARILGQDKIILNETSKKLRQF
ncbi:hypothetical protein ACFL25_00760 [Patescibacteria group bacterium]